MSEQTETKNTQPFQFDRKIVAGALAVFVAGWFIGQQASLGGLPWQPKQDRPILTFIAKVAKAGLWLLVVEPVPDDLPEYASVTDHSKVNHREGW
jgi:hypothetical protein